MKKRDYVPRAAKHARGSLSVSWWADHAKPDQRDAFMVAAKQRAIERVEQFRAVYPSTTDAAETIGQFPERR